MTLPVDSTMVLQIGIHFHKVIDHLYRDGMESLVGAVVEGGGGFIY